MPMNERRRLAEEAKAIIAETRREAERLTTCVTRSRALVAESKLLVAQSTGASADVYGVGWTILSTFLAGQQSN